MMQDEEIKNIIRKVAKESSSSDYYILSVKCLRDSISLTIIDQENAWKGELLLKDVPDTLCESLNTEREEYFAEVTSALEGNNNFTFIIENECFKVKKIDLKSTLKIRFCTIPVSKIPLLCTYSSLVESLIDCEENSKHLISNMTNGINELKQDRKNLIKKLQLLTEEKASLETTLYSQFCAILNSKKQKISSLESQLSSTNGQHLNIRVDNQDIKQEYEEQHLSHRTQAAESSMEHLTKSNEAAGNSNIVSATSGEGSKHLHSYDSETDVDTDEENSNNVTTLAREKAKCVPSTDTLKNKIQILPKRGTSSKLSSLKRKCPVEETTARESEEPEFNSQSLLNEY